MSIHSIIEFSLIFIMAGRISSLSRKERRISARKNQILDAALSLFAEKGYHRTTTKDIASAADVSEGTIYNYFDCKEDLLIGIMSRLSHPVDLSKLPASVQVDSREYLLSIVEKRLAFFQQNYSTLRAVLSEIMVNPQLAEQYYLEIVYPLQAQLQNNLQRWVERGRVRSIEPALGAQLIVAAIFGLFFLDSIGDEVLSHSDNLGQLLIDILFDGIQPGEGAR